jgi:hypothetical protein
MLLVANLVGHSPYRRTPDKEEIEGRCREWIKVKNRANPAFERAMLIALSKRTGSRSRLGFCHPVTGCDVPNHMPR